MAGGPVQRLAINLRAGGTIKATCCAVQWCAVVFVCGGGLGAVWQRSDGQWPDRSSRPSTSASLDRPVTTDPCTDLLAVVAALC